MEIPEMTLGGGIARCEQSLPPGNDIVSAFESFAEAGEGADHCARRKYPGAGLRSGGYGSGRARQIAKLLVQLGNLQKQTTPGERSRRGTRTISTSQS